MLTNTQLWKSNTGQIEAGGYLVAYNEVGLGLEVSPGWYLDNAWWADESQKVRLYNVLYYMEYPLPPTESYVAYRPNKIEAFQAGDFGSMSGSDGVEVAFKRGDWVCYSDDGTIFVLPNKVFNATFRKLD